MPSPTPIEAGESMGASPSAAKPNYELQPTDPDSPPTSPTTRPKSGPGKLKLIPLIFLIYFEVSGGPYGEEDAVGAAGPLPAILGFLIFPFIWSVPEALVTAELSTAFPGNGGYVIWAGRAFGPFWGSLMGYWKFLSGAVNNAAYPVLCADYLKLVFPVFAAGLWRHLAILVFNLLLAFLNYTGLTVVGYTAVTLGVVSLFPFLLMFFFALPNIRPSRWADLGQRGVDKDWPTFFNTLFWNLNFWDNASTLAGEVDRPQTTFPVALLAAGILTCAGYIVPLLAGTGALRVDQRRWEDGFLADAAGMIGGRWLKYWVGIGAVLSAVGLFEAQLSSCAYQLLGTAELGFLPKAFAYRSEWFGTPLVGILTSTAITLGMSYMTFGTIISAANFLYSMGMLLEFASFIWLRRKMPELKRPYRVPMRTPGLVVMCLVPSAFLVFVMVISGKVVAAISAGLTAVGVAGYFALGWCRRRGWLKFKKQVDGHGDDDDDDGEVVSSFRDVLAPFD